MEILDQKFSAAMLTMAATFVPGGFDVSEHAPSTYSELKAHLSAGRKMLIYSGGAEGTVHGHPEMNYAFRAWHDLAHLTGRHTFTLRGELGVWALQSKQLRAVLGDSAETRRWCAILHAEIVGQALYFGHHQDFPHDQFAFGKAFLQDPRRAIITRY
jgi:hypothetical protein